MCLWWKSAIRALKAVKGSPRDSLARHFPKRAWALSVLKCVCSTRTSALKKSLLIINGCTFSFFNVRIGYK